MLGAASRPWRAAPGGAVRSRASGLSGGALRQARARQGGAAPPLPTSNTRAQRNIARAFRADAAAHLASTHQSAPRKQATAGSAPQLTERHVCCMACGSAQRLVFEVVLPAVSCSAFSRRCFSPRAAQGLRSSPVRGCADAIFASPPVARAAHPCRPSAGAVALPARLLISERAKHRAQRAREARRGGRLWHSEMSFGAAGVRPAAGAPYCHPGLPRSQPLPSPEPRKAPDSRTPAAPCHPRIARRGRL